jgi:hypothetical protein
MNNRPLALCAAIFLVAAFTLGCRTTDRASEAGAGTPSDAVVATVVEAKPDSAAAEASTAPAASGSGDIASSAPANAPPRARFELPALSSPFDAGRIVAVGGLPDGVVVAALDALRQPSLLRVFRVVDGETVATEIARSTQLLDRDAGLRIAVHNGAVLWLVSNGQGVDFGSFDSAGVERSGRVEVVGVVGAPAAAWCGERLIVCGATADRAVRCASTTNEEAQSTLALGALPPLSQSNAGAADAAAWLVAGGVFAHSGDRAVTVVWLADHAGVQRAAARVVACEDAAAIGDVVDLAGESWAPRQPDWGARLHALADDAGLAWVLPSGENAQARAGHADLVSGQSARLQIDPTAAMTERPLLVASNGAPLFIYDAVGRDAERTFVRWRDGVATRFAGLTPLGAGEEALSARLAAAGDGLVALVVAHGQGAEVVVLAADVFTQAQ